MSFQRDFSWQKAYMPHVKRLLGEALFREGDWAEDALENSDLLVLRLDGCRVGCRIRRPKYFLRYPNDFTIRGLRHYEYGEGRATEMFKIMEGWGDYLFYGFAGSADRLKAAHLIDLSALRDHFSQPGTELPLLIPNGDGTFFHSFDIREYAELVVTRWVPPSQVPAEVVA